jgi:hypothetical protein
VTGIIWPKAGAGSDGSFLMVRRLLWLSLLAAGTCAVVTRNSSKVAAHEQRLNKHAYQIAQLSAGSFSQIPTYGRAQINTPGLGGATFSIYQV